MPNVDALLSCSQVWWALKTATADACTSTTLPAHFGVRIAVSLPVGSTLTAATLVKPLVDGVVSAAHLHDGMDEDELAERLASQLGLETSPVLALLRSGDGAVLGKRRLLWRWGSKVQWNPRDEDCVACEILLTRDASGSDFHMVVEILEVAPLEEAS